MRLHYTMAFAEAKAEYEAATHQYATFDDTGDGATEREEAAETRLSLADDAFFKSDAITPFEIAAKVSAAASRGADNFDVGAYYPANQILSDCRSLQRYAVSPEFAAAWDGWRELDEAWVNGDDGFGHGVQIDDLRNQAYCEIALKWCVTPGDFILKRYLSLLTSVGGCDSSATREDMTANRWDIDITEVAGHPRFDHADLLGSYFDIDSTDLGANLLAYGLVDFNPEAWMEAADRIGMRVDLIIDGDNKRSLGTTLDLSDDRDSEPRLRREKDRLMRIHAFDHDRTRLIGDEIEKNWPQLVYRLKQATSA